MAWKKGSGKLGIFNPLFGVWLAEAESEMGPVTCRREFKKVLDGKYIQLTAHWEYGDTTYNETTMIGVSTDKEICFWSFTSDGKQSQGTLTDVSDLHHDAVGFEAVMPAGLARQVYWPDEDGTGFYWAAEAHTKKGWRRMAEHHYLPDK